MIFSFCLVSLVVLSAFFFLISGCGGKHRASTPITSHPPQEIQLLKQANTNDNSIELIKTLIEELKQQINELPDEAFDKNPSQRKKEFKNQLNSVVNMLDSQNIEGAHNKFWQVITDKMDGLSGGNTSKR